LVGFLYTLRGKLRIFANSLGDKGVDKSRKIWILQVWRPKKRKIILVLG